ncbi:MAG: hypothetical protein FJW68_08630 [Actinobacteria bacterium]|nr:hypothetical protein [Actinomycetota bacterium]
MSFNDLTPEEERIIINKGTEPPFTGEYENFFEEGSYIFSSFHRCLQKRHVQMTVSIFP